MKNIKFLTVSGVLMLIAGILLIFSHKTPVVGYVYPILFILSAICAYAFAKDNKAHKIAYSYHLMQAIGLTVFGLISLLLFKQIETFELLIVLFLLIFGIVEIIFAFSVLNSGQNINKFVLLYRIVVGAVNLIGGFTLVMVSFSDPTLALKIAGCLIAFGGTSFIVFAQRVK